MSGNETNEKKQSNTEQAHNIEKHGIYIDPQRKIRERREIFRALGLMSQIGIVMVISILLGLFGGKFLDDWLNCSPLFLIIGIILGIGAAFRNLYDLVIKDFTDNKR